MSIRPRRDEDLAACAEALRKLHETDRYPHSLPDDPVSWLRPPRQRHAWVAVDAGSGEVAGHVALNVAEGDPALGVETAATGLGPEQLAVVSRLFVVRAYRRRGLGRALLDQAQARARAEGLRPVLDVLEADRAAVSLYERAGWIRIGTITFHARDGEALPAFVYAAAEPDSPPPSSLSRPGSPPPPIPHG